MKKEEILNLVKIGEGYTLEFKENLPSDLGKHICAFANASGGKIILGVRDDGTAAGYNLTNQDEARISNTARNLEPPIQVHVQGVDSFAVIDIPRSDNKPHSSGGHFYLRIGSTSQQLKRDEIRDFFLKERLFYFDEKPNMAFDFTIDFNRLKFEEYLKKAKITPLSLEKDTLRNLNLLDEKYIRNAGVLFFSNKIKKFFLSATVACVLYQGTSKETILDLKEFDEDIISNYENALTYIYSKLNTNFIIKAERTEKLELPKEALREALINAMVHRDYFSNGHVQVDIYLDRINISNPGGLVSGLALKDLGRYSMPRNPLLMDLFLRIDKVEKVGSGIERIRKAMKEYGLEITFDANENWFSAVFPRVLQTQKTGHAESESSKEATKGVSEINPKLHRNFIETAEIIIKKAGLQSRIPSSGVIVLACIIENKQVTTSTITKKLEITERAVADQLAKLKLYGIIKRIGPDKGGYWEITGKNR